MESQGSDDNINGIVQSSKVSSLELVLALRDGHVISGEGSVETIYILQPVGGHYTLALQRITKFNTTVNDQF